VSEGKPLESSAAAPSARRRPSQSDVTLDLSGLAGVTLFEPEELVLRHGPARRSPRSKPLSRAKGQQLAFEPWTTARPTDAAGTGSLGGALAANLSGPRRIKAGAAPITSSVSADVRPRRDLQSGGRVVKNVTGYEPFASCWPARSERLRQ